MAVSIELLRFYHALFERSADAVTALAAALQAFYSIRGWDVLDQEVRDVVILPGHKTDI